MRHCRRTCRDLQPYAPQLWCSGCKEDEAADVEANRQRWAESEQRRLQQERLDLIATNLLWSGDCL